MLKSSLVIFLLSLLSSLDGALAQNNQGNRDKNGNNAANNNNNNNNANNNANTGLSAQVIQSASASNGNPSEGQAPSLTDTENFINFCQGKTVTNGQQLTGGSCNGIVMGDIPSKDNMIAAMIQFPQTGQPVQANTAFDVSVQVQNLVAGVFTNPDVTYYAAPQQLQGGKVIGHCHVVIQKLQSLNDATPPSAATFTFFKGINDDGNGRGLLKATVTNGLPVGFYRVCTMMGTSNHQPPLMPVAQRGAQEDCTKFEVTTGGNNGGNNNGNAANTGTVNNGNNQNGNVGKSNGNTAINSNNGNTATGASTTTAVTTTGRGRNGGAQTTASTTIAATSTTVAAAAASSSSTTNDGTTRNGRTGDRNNNNGAKATTSNNGSMDDDRNQINRGDVSGATGTTSSAPASTATGDHRHQHRYQGRRYAPGRRYVVTPDEPAPGFQARAFIV